MKKVLYVSANGFVGGAEKFLVNVAKVHYESGDAVHFLLFDDGNLVEELKNNGAAVTVLKNRFRLRNPFKLFFALNEIKVFLRKHKFETIHSTMGYSHLIMGLATMFSDMKRVWFQHGPIGGMVDYIASLFRVDILMFSSHYLKEKHYSKLLLRKAKYGTKVVPLPVQYIPPKLTEGFALRKNLHLEGAYVLGMVGRINEGKGYHIAIKAFLGLNLENAKLVIVGSANKQNEKNYLESLKKIVEKQGAEDRVVFVPHQNNVSVYYKIMDIYLNPVTIDEGFGLSVAEAMAAGVTVISSPYGGLSEFVKSNETAEVVMAKESDAVESLKELILKLKNNEILAKTLSKNARELIESRFNFSQTYIALTDVYQFLDSLD